MTQLQINKNLFAALNSREIRYCHWKSNEHLGAGLGGFTDLDILIERGQHSLVEEILLSQGAKRLETRANIKYPAIEDFVNLDVETGKMVHYHMHYRLVLGEKHLKGFRLPWEKLILDTRILDQDSGVYCIDPNLELMLLVIREVLKLRFRDKLGALLGIRYPRKGFRTEYDWLASRVTAQRLETFCRKVLGERPVAVFRKIAEKRPDLGMILRVKHAILKRLNAYRTQTRLASGIIRFFRELAWLLAGFKKRFLNVRHANRRTLPAGGCLVALLGSDGSGKSTLLKELKKTFSWKIDVFTVYFGSGDGPGSLLRLPLTILRTIFVKKGFGRTRETGKTVSERGSGSKKKKGLKQAVYDLGLIVWTVALTLEKKQKLKKARQARNAGMLVIADRYPQTEVLGFNDGPLLAGRRRSLTGLVRRIAVWEQNVYATAYDIAPDLVIRLNVSPSVAVARKPEMSLEEVTRRVTAIKSLRFGGTTDIRDIDADQPLFDVQRAVKARIWERL